MNMIILKAEQSLYYDMKQNEDSKVMYCEITYKRDKSSFAGMFFTFLEEENVFLVQEKKERLVRVVDKYENIYVGSKLHYINALRSTFSMKERSYGLEVISIVYSNIKSSEIIFEDLMKKLDENITMWKEKVDS